MADGTPADIASNEGFGVTGVENEMTKMVEVTQEDAINYCRVLENLGIEESMTDPVAVIEMLRSWEVNAQARADLLEKHLRYVLEVARTWTPEYATPMDLATLRMAEVLLTPNDRVQPPTEGAARSGSAGTRGWASVFEARRCYSSCE